MASYTNLASLAGLQVGDTITYNTDMAIDFAKYKVRITLNGIGYNSSKGGGVTQFDLDGTKLPAQTLKYTPLYGTSLIYGSNTDMYYRIAVAGNCGYFTANGGKGGGLQGQSGNSGSSVNMVGGSAGGGGGGTQTAGGSGGSGGSGGMTGTSHTSGTAGAFGRNPAINTIAGGIDRYDYFMAGWYSGGTGGYASYSKGTTYYSSSGYPGGGSGFVIGNSTTTYPSGYLGNNATLQTNIASAVSNATLTQGASTAYYTTGADLPTTAFMTITILEVPKSFPKYYNGSAWVDTEWKYYNGSTWKDIELKYYDGSAWKDVG